MDVIRKLFCKHKHKKCVTNLYGDYIHMYNCRSIWECDECHKWIYSKELEPTCKTINFEIKKD